MTIPNDLADADSVRRAAQALDVIYRQVSLALEGVVVTERADWPHAVTLTVAINTIELLRQRMGSFLESATQVVEAAERAHATEAINNALAEGVH